MELNQKVDMYAVLQKEAEELKAKMDALKAEIIEDMESEGLVKTTTDNDTSVSLVYKETIKYSDEPAILKYCEDRGLNNYVVKKVNTTALNKDLKKSSSLTEDLNSFYLVNKTKVLTVKGK